MPKTSKSKRIEIYKGINMAKIYLIVSIVKFPHVISKNGILNGTLAILLVGGICSTIANFLLSKMAFKFNQKSYEGISEHLMSNLNSKIRLSIFAFRSIVLFYMIDLSNRFLQTSGIEVLMDIKYTPYLLSFLILLTVFLIPNPNALISGLTRNTISFAIMGLVTSAIALANYNSNINKINFSNPSDKAFESFPLTFICFTQQLGTTPLLSTESNSKTKIISCGLFSSLSYILIGIIGYLGSPKNDLNWFSSLKNQHLKIILSLIFLIFNLLPIPLVFGPVKDELFHFLRVESNSNLESIGTAVLLVLFVFSSLKFVPTKLLGVFCLTFSAIVMIILPSLFYFKSKDTSRGAKILANLNFGIGSFFIAKSIYDYVGLIMN